MYTEKDIETVKNIILQNVPNIARIILFGSYARGDAESDSDMDFMILTEAPMERNDEMTVLSKARWLSTEAGYDADFLKDSSKPTLASVIAAEGKTLWKKN